MFCFIVCTRLPVLLHRPRGGHSLPAPPRLILGEGTSIKESSSCFDCTVGEDGTDPWKRFFGDIAFLVVDLTSM